MNILPNYDIKLMDSTDIIVEIIEEVELAEMGFSYPVDDGKNICNSMSIVRDAHTGQLYVIRPPYIHQFYVFGSIVYWVSRGDIAAYLKAHDD